MSVVHAGAQHRIAPLQQGAEGHLGARREVAHRAQVAFVCFGPTWKGTGWGGGGYPLVMTNIAIENGYL